MTEKDIHQKIRNILSDLVSNFLYYDRKEDEELGVGEINKAIESRAITVTDIKMYFSEELQKGLRHKL
jgi:hypothetical protein